MAANPKYMTAWLNETTGDIHTPKIRLLYPNLFEAKANRKIPGSAPKFNALALIPKGADITLLQNEVVRAAKEKHGAGWKALWDAKKLRLPLVPTADEPKLAEYAEEYPWLLKVSANEEYPPFVYGPDTKRIQDGTRADAYGGRWAVIAGAAWGYSTGSLGVGWNLGRIQLLDHDEPIGNARVETSEGFEPAVVAGAQQTHAPLGGGKPASADNLWAA